MTIIVVQTKGFSKGAAVFKSVRINGALRKDKRKGIGERETGKLTSSESPPVCDPAVGGGRNSKVKGRLFNSKRPVYFAPAVVAYELRCGAAKLENVDSTPGISMGTK